MKKFLFPILLFFLIIGSNDKVHAQFLKDLKKKVEKKVNYEADKRSTKRAYNAVDDVFDKAEGLLDKAIGKAKGTSKSKNAKNSNKNNSNTNIAKNNNHRQTGTKGNSQGQKSKPAPKLVWSKFDFVPGDQVIFEDGPSPNEENGEFPSRWDLYQGGAEIAEVDGEPVIMFITDVGNMYRKGIVPYLKNSKNDYLPDVFTIEFDAYFPPKAYNNRYYLSFFDRKNQSTSETPQVEFNVNAVKAGESESTYKGKSRGNWDDVGGWRHFSIAYTKGKLKVYMDDQRMINIPHVKGNPTGVTLAGAFENSFVKNFRIAKGGVKYYDRVLSDGKIIVNGIKFDVNKATLKPESMGPINRIYQLMVKNPDLKFSVEGHTDSDGDTASNLKLSKARAKTVMDKLISMGISKDRLKYTGYGESKPIDTNNTPEGKANNRRVEFVKF